MEKKIALGLLLTLVLVVFIPVYWLREPARKSAAMERQRLETLERGAELFAINCTSCHGDNGEGLIGPRLEGTALDEEALEKTISRGRLGDPVHMPAWSEEDDGPLKKYQIRYLVTFVKNWDDAILQSVKEEIGEGATDITPEATQAREEGAGDVERGIELYANQGCSVCHGARAEGGIGPSLLGYSEEEIRSQIRNPVGSMPAYSASQLSDADLQDIVAFIQSIR